MLILWSYFIKDNGVIRKYILWELRSPQNFSALLLCGTEAAHTAGMQGFWARNARLTPGTFSLGKESPSPAGPVPAANCTMARFGMAVLKGCSHSSFLVLHLSQP